MTIRANKFTPEVLLGAPRRSEGNPNSNGSQVLYSISTYSFDEHAKTSEIRVLDVNSGETSLITDKEGASEPQWLDDETILVLSESDDGTSVIVGPVKDFDNRCVQYYLGIHRRQSQGRVAVRCHLRKPAKTPTQNLIY